MNIVVKRTFIKEDGQFGILYVPNLKIQFMSLENNLKKIPTGTYDLKLDYSPSFKMNLWELYNVPNRSECKIHVANYPKELEGCIAIGTGFYSGDTAMILSSKDALTIFMNKMKQFEGQTLKIIIED